VSTTLLEIAGLKKSFAFKTVLRGIDLALGSGERMALMGANGVGKTTLLRILACLTSPSSGSARIGGWDIERDAQRVRRLVGFVAHQPYLYDELTAEENLLFFGKMYAVKDARERTGQLLLLDEPDTGLDEEGHELVEQVLAEHSVGGGAVLFTTHQLERALQLADHLVMLSKGRIVVQEKTAGLELERMRQEYQEVLR